MQAKVRFLVFRPTFKFFDEPIDSAAITSIGGHGPYRYLGKESSGIRARQEIWALVQYEVKFTQNI